MFNTVRGEPLLTTMKSGLEKLETSLYRVLQNAFRLNRLGVSRVWQTDVRT